MSKTIKNIKPDMVKLSELRAGDNFQSQEHGDWVFKKISGVKKFIVMTSPYCSENVSFAVTECSGEAFSFKESEMVYPLIEPDVEYEYDFSREFESKRKV